MARIRSLDLDLN